MIIKTKYEFIEKLIPYITKKASRDNTPNSLIFPNKIPIKNNDATVKYKPGLTVKNPFPIIPLSTYDRNNAPNNMYGTKSRTNLMSNFRFLC